MLVFLTHVECYLPFAEALVPGLRTYWGQRGIAVHHMDFNQTVKEAALAANYHLAAADPAYNEKDGFKNLVEAIRKSRPITEWMQLFINRSKRETAEWDKNDLIYIILVTNLHFGDYHACNTPYGPHMVLNIGSSTNGAGELEAPTEEWVSQVQKNLVEEYSMKLKAGFRE